MVAGRAPGNSILGWLLLGASLGIGVGGLLLLALVGNFPDGVSNSSLELGSPQDSSKLQDRTRTSSEPAKSVRLKFHRHQASLPSFDGKSNTSGTIEGFLSPSNSGRVEDGAAESAVKVQPVVGPLGAGPGRTQDFGESAHAEVEIAGSTPLGEPDALAGGVQAGQRNQAGSTDWSPATARQYWIDYLQPRLSLDGPQSSFLADTLDEGRHSFNLWDPGRLRTEFAQIGDPALQLDQSAPFRAFRGFLRDDQLVVFDQIAPRWDSAAGTLEVRIAPNQ